MPVGSSARCPNCSRYVGPNANFCPICGIALDEPVDGQPRAANGLIYRYDKPGARVYIYRDRIELTNGVLWAKKTHVLLMRGITGVSVLGAGGHTLRVESQGRSYEVAVGLGVAAKLRQIILDNLSG